MILTFLILLLTATLSIPHKTDHSPEHHIRTLKRKATSKFKNVILIIADDLGYLNFDSTNFLKNIF